MKTEVRDKNRNAPRPRNALQARMFFFDRTTRNRRSSDSLRNCEDHHSDLPKIQPNFGYVVEE
jgi:hypothetical protein